MPRLGELLVAAGLLTPERLEQALRAQIMWGARLGTNLVELGFIDLDALSSALAQQHQLPAALARHFEQSDPALQQQLSPQLADQHACVPLTRVGPKRQIVIASASPLTFKAMAAIAASFGDDPMTLITSIAAELRIRYQLERVYNIGRPSRFMRSPGKTIPPFPEFVIEDAEPESDLDLPIAEAEAELTHPVLTGEAPEGGLDDESITVSRPSAEVLAVLEDLAPSSDPPLDEAKLRERRRYIRTIADAPPAPVEPAPVEPAPVEPAIGRIAIKRGVVAAVEASTTAESTSLSDATRGIRRAKDRDKVAELAIAALSRFAPTCDAAVLLVVRGQAATAWKGFNRSSSAAPEINVPLDQPGLVPRAIAANATMLSVASQLDPIDQLLLTSLGPCRGDVAVVPIAIGKQVMCVIAMVTTADEALMTAESVAAATSAAFSRMLRDAAR